MIMQKTDNYVMLFNEIFNMARKIIKERFNIAICKRYKHYWFLKIYFSYILGGIVSAKEFLFIDEARDLSPVEINLLHKLNTLKGGTVCNLFGDVKQVISRYCCIPTSCLLTALLFAQKKWRPAKRFTP